MQGDELHAVYTETPIYIRPENIRGANTLRSWMGRGYKGREKIKEPQTGAEMPSVELICDYASRLSPIPPVTLDVFMTPDRKIVHLSQDAHRAAAAKLRGEPLAATGFHFYISET